MESAPGLAFFGCPQWVSINANLAATPGIRAEHGNSDLSVGMEAILPTHRMVVAS